MTSNVHSNYQKKEHKMTESHDQDAVVRSDDSGLLSTDGTAWNVQLTGLLRNTDRYAWGNWTLDPTIQVGTVGWFSLTDSQFQSTGVNFTPPTMSENTDTDWHLEQGDVKQTTVGVDFKVPYVDPSTGTKVTVGLESTWDFGTKGSLTSQGTTIRVDYAKDPADYMLKKYDEFLALAKNYNKAADGKIDQAFGMITKAWYTSGCVNIGSRQNNSTFSITGSVDGVSAMTGGDESASLKGSYKSITNNDNVEKRIFPGSANIVETQPVVYAYEFTSFAGKIIIPRWIADISYLNLWLDNGGTYIVKATVTYVVDGQTNTRKITVSGGMDQQITGIPLGATDMNIELNFVAGNSQFLRVQNPLSAWYLGRGHLKLTGVWPGKSGAKWID